jgi:hypothetical protein
MPIDPFAVLNAILRAEAARAEKARLRRPAAADNNVVAAGARSGAARDRTPAASAPDESRTPR